MKNQNRIYKLLLGAALIAELCFFLPDVKAQTDTSKTYSWSGQRITIDVPKPDTIAVEMFIATDSIPMQGGCWYKFPAKVLIVMDGYRVTDYWHISDMQYLDDKKQPMKSKVYISLPRDVGKK